jgi:hypothetical protein
MPKYLFSGVIMDHTVASKASGPNLFSRFFPISIFSVLLSGILLLLPTLAYAQQGDGTIQGTISDKTGSVIPNASVSVLNTSTGVEVVRTSNKVGDFTVTPLQAGHYTVSVTAKGFERLVQENVTLNSLQTLGLNLKLSIGTESDTITVTDAPPMLDTQDASLGGTIENELYTQLPLSMNGGPRDPTQFAYLMPGVQEGDGVTGVYGGTGQGYLNQSYINGMPVSTINAQGDPTTVRNAVSVDAVDQFQVKTNGAGVQFGGAGVTNYSIKAGGDRIHGTVFDYIRNTAFDTWGYFSKVPGANGYAVKPGEHQNSYGASLGGPIINDKLFYFVTYEGFHYTKISNTPQYLTVPTMRERTGDFTDAFGTGDATQPGVAGIFDPTPGGNRNQFRGLLNGVPTFNVIPSQQISSISQNLAKALPAPTNLATVNNYLAGLPLEQDDYRMDVRLDYTITPRHKITIIGLGGLNGYNTIPRYSTQIQLPFPYAAGTFTSQKTSTGILTYTFVVSQAMVNTLNYGYTRGWGNSFSPTKGTAYTAAKAGIGNLPPGNAADTFPSVTFGGGAISAESSPTNFASNVDSGPQSTNNYTIIDNLVWVKGRHNLTFGAQIQWLETNAASYAGFSGPTALTYSAYNTENLNFNTSSNILNGGSAYASFLVGAVYTGNVRTQSITDVGGRYHPIAPYVQDSWRVTSKLTLNLGLRYDYLQPYHEVKDRIAFINPTLTNPITGNLGVIQFGGFGSGPNSNYAPYICQCHTPIHPYNKNFEPSIALAYSPNRSLVIRSNFAVITTHAGGTGGHANATAGPGNNSEYAYTQVWQGSGSTSAPSFFLNPSVTGSPQNSLYSPGTQGGQADYASLPPWPAAGNLVNPLSTTGNYDLSQVANPALCANPSSGIAGATSGACNPSTQNYVDLYYGGRGPQFVNYNLGIQQMINRSAVLSINYVGSQTHFLPGGAGRGYATNSISPDCIQPLANLVVDGAAPINVLATQVSTLSDDTKKAIVAACPAWKVPYALYSGPQATVAHALSAFPQFGNLTDIWGATGNSNYNALQVSIIQRPWHGLSGFMNYTWSKSIDDTGNHRTQYPVGPQDGNFSHYYSANAVDRGLGTYDQRHNFNATFNYESPIGRGKTFFAKSAIADAIGGGWSLSGILKLRQGFPLQITTGNSAAEGCITSQNAFQGSCMPDYNPNVLPNQARINGKWGRAPGANASNIQTIQYLNPNAFTYPDNNANSYKLGNIARSAPDGLRGPGWKDLDLGIRRTFTVRDTESVHLTFQVEADVTNVTNSTYFVLATGATQWNTCAAGLTTIAQCAANAYGTIGGQNPAVPPRDWQFAGRFRF